MTISEAIAQAKALTGEVVDDNVLLRWLSELDGKIAMDAFGADAWTPYEADETGDTLLVDFPWDGRIYVPYLEAMIYYSSGEYDRYENAKTMYETALLEYRKWYSRNHLPVVKCYARRNYCNGKETRECPLS